MSDGRENVMFDVGGKQYKVSCSLIDRFPSTILARMTSEVWRGADDDKPIFIDRDGETFRYCLDYMRDGHVSIPITVSKGALIKDLNYYGFTDIDEGAIECDGSTGLAFAHMYRRFRDLEKEGEALQTKGDFMLLAAECAKRRLNNRDASAWCKFYHDKDKAMFKASKKAINTLDEFRRCLSKFGLKLEGHSTSFCGPNNHCCFGVDWLDKN